MNPAERGPDRVALAAFAGVVLLGGTNFVAAKFTIRELAPFWGAGTRFLAAAAILFAIVFARRLPLPKGGALIGAVIYGTLGFFVFYALAYYALDHLPAGIVSVTAASAPLLTLLLAVAQRLESFRWRGLAGAVLAIAGVAIMAGRGAGADLHLPAILAVIGAAASASEAGLLLKRFPGSHPITTNAVGMATGAVLLIAASVLTGEPRTVPTTTSTWVALLYLVALGSVALFILFVIALNRWTASGVSYQFVLFPVVAVLLSAWLLDERMTLPMAAGGALVLAGTYVGALSGRRVSPTEPEAPLEAQASAAGRGPPC
ncbi:MAG: DMT family transporter [Actinomycetota bacterium]